MPRGHTTRLTVSLTSQERRTLEVWQRTLTLPAGQVRRGRIILLLAEGRTITQIAHAIGISRRFVYKWVRRFQAQGLAGLADLPRPTPGRPEAAQAQP